MNLSPFNAGAWWFLNPMEWPRIEAMLEQSTSPRPSPHAAHAEREEMALAARPKHDAYGAEIQQMRMVEGVAIVPVKGPLLKGAHPAAKLFGFSAYEDVVEDLDSARAQNAKGVVLEIGSPGGMAVGAGELGSVVADFAKHTPVFSFTDSMSCSAAEYLSGACTARFATADAIVGSIGTILTTISFEGMLKDIGIKADVFASGKFKGAGHPMKDLTPEQAEYLQGFVNTLADEFKGHMAKHRTGMSMDSMQGQVFTGRQASANGLIDANVRSLAEVVGYLK